MEVHRLLMAEALDFLRLDFDAKAMSLDEGERALLDDAYVSAPVPEAAQYAAGMEVTVGEQGCWRRCWTGWRGRWQSTMISRPRSRR